MTVHAYLRVSTDHQDTDAQTLGLFQYAKARGLRLENITEDKASGAIPWRKRKLADVLAATQPGDSLIVPEISRIERTTLGVLGFLEAAAAAGVAVHIIKSGMVLDATMQSKIITTVLALCAEIEREMIRARTVEGMAKARAAGKVLGRAGRPNNAYKLDAHTDEIKRLLAHRVPLRAIARICDVHHTTLSRYIKNRALAGAK